MTLVSLRIMLTAAVLSGLERADRPNGRSTKASSRR